MRRLLLALPLAALPALAQAQANLDEMDAGLSTLERNALNILQDYGVEYDVRNLTLNQIVELIDIERDRTLADAQKQTAVRVTVGLE